MNPYVLVIKLQRSFIKPFLPSVHMCHFLHIYGHSYAIDTLSPTLPPGLF